MERTREDLGRLELLKVFKELMFLFIYSCSEKSSLRLSLLSLSVSYEPSMVIAKKFRRHDPEFLGCDIDILYKLDLEYRYTGRLTID